MSNKAFQQNLDDKKGPQPGGPYLIQMLFKEPVEMPDKEKMTAIMEKHIGSTECFCYDKKMAGFAALDHVAEFQDGKCPVQLMVMKCDKFKGKGFDAFLMSQMWDCQEDRDRIFRECKYQVVATDMLTAALPALERANLDADFLEALAELYPTCEAFYFQNCGKLFLAEDVRSHQIEGPDRFIRFGVNVRFFNIEGTEDMLIDTVGMSTLFLPDLQYHFHDIIDNIQTAIGNHQQIRFQYYEYTQEKKKILKHDGYYYVVNPYALEWKNDHYYLIGFSLKHQKIAHFRVDRLTSVENLETYFMPIEGFDVASYTNKMVDMFTSESSKEVTLLCENELMRVIIDHYGEDAAVDRYDDTHFTAKIEVNPSGTFYGWIFKFKGKIKILSPKECITEMQQIAQEFI